MPYNQFFINPIHFIFNYFIILLILFLYLNLFFYKLINLFHFDIYQILINVLDLIIMFI